MAVINRVPIKDYVMPFGKFRGRPIRDIMKKHPKYFEWLDKAAYGDFKVLLEKIKEENKWQEMSQENK